MDGKPRLIALLLLLIMGNTDPRERFLRVRPGSACAVIEAIFAEARGKYLPEAPTRHSPIQSASLRRRYKVCRSPNPLPPLTEASQLCVPSTGEGSMKALFLGHF